MKVYVVTAGDYYEYKLHKILLKYIPAEFRINGDPPILPTCYNHIKADLLSLIGEACLNTLDRTCKFVDAMMIHMNGLKKKLKKNLILRTSYV